MDKGSFLAEDIVEYNKRHKAELELRRCMKCINFNKTVYKCKLKECINK
jgi:hypothetical protein